MTYEFQYISITASRQIHDERNITILISVNFALGKSYRIDLKLKQLILILSLVQEYVEPFKISLIYSI